MCSPTLDTHIRSEIYFPTWKHISLVIYVPLPGKHTSLVNLYVLLPGKDISLVIFVLVPGKHISLVICVSPPGKHMLLLSVILLLPKIFLTTLQDGFDLWLTVV